MEVQAQNGNMRLFAEKKLTITSEDDILFAGKKRITLMGGGSYLRLEAGKVEYGTTGTYMRRVKRTMAAGSNTQDQSPTKMADPLPNLSCGPFVACFHVTDLNTGNEGIPFAWQITTETGTIQGQTQAALTNVVNSDSEEPVSLDYVCQIRAGIR